MLTCRGATSGGSLFKSVELVKEAKGLVVKSVDYSGQKNESEVKSTENSPVSTKYILDAANDEKTSLVASLASKQAVILYEGVVDGANKTIIEFLKCK